MKNKVTSYCINCGVNFFNLPNQFNRILGQFKGYLIISSDMITSIMCFCTMQTLGDTSVAWVCPHFYLVCPFYFVIFLFWLITYHIFFNSYPHIFAYFLYFVLCSSSSYPVYSNIGNYNQGLEREEMQLIHKKRMRPKNSSVWKRTSKC